MVREDAGNNSFFSQIWLVTIQFLANIGTLRRPGVIFCVVRRLSWTGEGLVSDILRNFGYEVIEAVDGADAVEKFKENMGPIDLVILDVIMPNKNGRQAYEEMRAMKPGTRALFTSGYPAEVFRNGESAGERFNFISKPVSPRDLLEKVREVLEE